MVRTSWRRWIARTLAQPRPARPFKPQLTALEGREVPAVFTVTNTNPTGAGSLYDAIHAANSNGNPAQLDYIGFNIPGTPAAIKLTTPLETITQAVLIDGYTQPGTVVNTTNVGNDAKLLIELDGSQLAALNFIGASGLSVKAPLCTIQGLVINQFDGNGISLDKTAGGTAIRGNFIGTDRTGKVARGNHGDGVYIASELNTVGGNAAPDRNVISGNGASGIYITGVSANGNSVRGNYLGTTATGAARLGNLGDGVQVDDASATSIGGIGGGNLISGNGGFGVRFRGAGVTSGILRGNVIGLDAAGTVPLGNDVGGVDIYKVGGVVVGGPGAGEGNTVSANGGDGVRYYQCPDAVVQGNLIGTAPYGVSDYGNLSSGLAVVDTPNAQVGGSAPGAGNVISGNNGAGVVISGVLSAGAKVVGNVIGLDKAGTQVIANDAGVYVVDAANVRIGGSGAGERNVISGNTRDGVYVSGTAATGTVIRGNYIGTDHNGQYARGNGGNGITLRAPGAAIGGGQTGEGNVISGNLSTGVYLDSDAPNTLVVYNLIGTDFVGAGAVGNHTGILIGSDANFLKGNVIADSDGDGVYLSGSNNSLYGNFIGTNPGVKETLGNGYGLDLAPTAKNNRIGDANPALGNVIAHSANYGLNLAGSGNTVRGNSIYDNNGVGLAPVGAPNDPKDADTGPNGRQNFPVITGATTSGGQTTVTGTINTTPNTQVVIELFGNAPSAANDYEGKTVLGSVTVTTDANGDATFTMMIPAANGGTRFTGTATNLGTNETSVFSEPFVADIGVSVFGQAFDDANGNGVLDPGEGSPEPFLVFLDGNGNGVRDSGEPIRSVTGGQYFITLDGEGTFQVVALPTAGKHVTTPVGPTFTAASGTIVNGPAIGIHTDAQPPVVPVTPPPVVLPPAPVLFAVGADAGGLPTVSLYNPDGSFRSSFQAFDAGFTGGVRVAVADVTGDGLADVIVAAGAGGAPHVRVFDGAKLANGLGADASQVASFFAFDAAFRGGVTVAAADVNGDGKADVVVGAGSGGAPHVKVFDGATGAEVRSFFAFDAAFRGGVNVAAADTDGDGIADIVTGAGPGGAPHVKVFDGKSGSELQSFLAFDAAFRGGVSVTAGDVNGDGIAEVVTAAGAGGAPHVRVFGGVTRQEAGSFFADDPASRDGVSVAARDLDGDGRAEVVTGSGAGSRVRVFGGKSVQSGVPPVDLVPAFDAFPDILGGVFVG